MNFDWDPAKSERNVRQRGFGFDVAVLVFAGDTIEVEDARKDYGEVRFRAIGEVAGIVLSVVYTDRGKVRRIISARPADRKERHTWHAR